MFARTQTLFRSRPPDSARATGAADDVARVAIGEDGRVVYASPAFCALSHISLENGEVVEAASILSLEDNAAALNSIGPGLHRVRINGHKNGFDFRFDWMTTPANRRYLVGSRSEARTARDTDMREFVAKIEQAEKTRAAEGETKLAAGDFETFTSLSNDVMVVVDALGTILRANDSFHRVFGTDAQALAGMDFIDIFAEEDKPFIRSSMQTLSFGADEAGNPAAQIEAQVRAAGGEIRIMEWQQARRGELFFCTGRDITAIRAQKKELANREKQLLRAESIGRMGHWQWTIGHESIEWSPEVFRIFGVEHGRFKPTLESMNRMINRRDIGRVNQAFQRAIIERNDYDVEFRVLRPDGETRFIRCEGRCARDDEGDVIALFGVMQDMTERMLYESELRAAKDASERAYAAKSQFLANMSHELRTPLNAIIGFSEMMQRQLLGPIGTEKYLDYIGGIRESGEHLLDLISDILDMSKIEAGKYELDLVELNVTKTIGMATHMMEGRALDAQVKIITDSGSIEGKVIIADRRAFMQIMLNLLSNAVKFSKAGGTVHIGGEIRGDSIVLKVADTGIGIPANKLAHITRPFEQVAPSYTREHEGSGLGLAITKELVEMHNGTLQIESTEGKGTTVTVRLPQDASRPVANART